MNTILYKTIDKGVKQLTKNLKRTNTIIDNIIDYVNETYKELEDHCKKASKKNHCGPDGKFLCYDCYATDQRIILDNILEIIDDGLDDDDE